ncbi:MAG: hypothetical protein JWQ81_4252 [Amycolatopsis sp.]|uniref:cell division protein PerM n=1 Tax=Amycolatopsis sp. TaxID=37632 RepID=UPI0026252F3E|nr:DUF6350 family protein [Amycolatopsis sp.]MCU1683513.1 hypothetical protein [Amycolatopsis sp.]
MTLLSTSSAGPPDGEWLDDAEFAPEVSRATRVRVLLAAALGPLITGYALVAAVFALITVTAENARFSASNALLAAGPGWLAAHQVPVEIAGHPLGVLPLVPTVGACFLIARTAAGCAHRLGCREPAQAISVLGVIAGSHALFGVVIAVLSHGDLVTAEPMTAFLVPGLVAGLAAAAGLAKPCGFARVIRAYLDPLALAGLRAGALGMAALLACGALVLTVSLALSASTVHDLFEPGFGSSFGLFLLSLVYLPNAIVAALSFAAGPGFSIGSVSVSTVGLSGGPVPGVPLLGGIPLHHAAWWPALMLLPAAAGALVGWSVRNVHDEPFARLRTVAVAGALIGFGCVILGTLAGGRLGGGVFDPVSVPVGVASVVTFCWIVIPGCLVTFFAGPHEPAAPAEAVDEFEEPDVAEAEEGEEAAEAVDVQEDAEDVEDSGDSEDSEDSEDSGDAEDAEESEGDAEAVVDEVTETVEEDAEPAEVDSAFDTAADAVEEVADVTGSTAESVDGEEPEADR